MKIHLAERDPQHHGFAQRGVVGHRLQLRVLLSYWYFKDLDLDVLFQKHFTEPYPEVFADSGAFTAMTKGVTIKPKDYATWVKRWRHLIQTYANLDVIKNAEGTWRNQVELEDRFGLEPLPVFHVLEDWSWLERYIDRYPYIGLGVAGMQGRGDAVMRWLTRCFRMAGSQSVFHGFGLTSWTVMSSLRWYSVDSSSWGQGFRFGGVPVFDSIAGVFRKIRLGDTQSCYKHARLIRDLGFDPADFADRKRNKRATIYAISALSYMKAEQWLRKRHGEVLIPNRPGAPAGLRAHLADANPRRFVEAMEGASGPRLHLSDTSMGINFGDADRGLKTYLVDTTAGAADVSSAAQGIKVHLVDALSGGADLGSDQRGIRERTE